MDKLFGHTDNLNTATSNTNEVEKVWLMLEQVTDPEIPVLSIVDLGIVREIKIENSSPSLSSLLKVCITITPTYSGCPAMDMIAVQIQTTLFENGYSDIKINTALSPAWTTDWMTEKGKEKLKAYGIAPPIGKSFGQKYLEELQVQCPQCNSNNTRLISAFSSTSCKALYQCNDCKEPFDYFKCH
jgi:ring-1,2-phenylacetyl-CoA epoxidase subunit PaaD